MTDGGHVLSSIQIKRSSIRSAFKVLRFKTVEKSGKYLYGILMINETSYSLQNVGDGRRDHTRWDDVTQFQLLAGLKDDRVEFIAFSRFSCRDILKHRTGLGRSSTIRDAAKAENDRLRT